MGGFMLKLGIVTISFNQATFLPQAVTSVQMQDASRLSYAIVDPGSTDGSREIIHHFAPRFSQIIFDPDHGPADGLNKGFAAIPEANILGYINSDDYYAPGALDYVLDYFEHHPEIDILTAALRIVDAHGKEELRGRISDPLNLSMFAARCCLICQQGTFFRREAFEKVGGFNIQNKTCWDSELFVDMALAGFKVATLPKVLGYFRSYDTSITSVYQKTQSEQYLRDWTRIKQKIASQGIYQYPGVIESGLRLLYKLNMARHWRWLLVK
jgi:GT2 family glycosyltransferase